MNRTVTKTEFSEGEITRLLSKAAEIDPEAWACPFPARLQKRRNESFKRAYEQFKPSIGDV
jgi:hypothetical protein